MANRVLVIDFETANFSSTSACAIGAILIENGEIVQRYHSLIKPPSKVFQFTYIHGITWNDVKDAPNFKAVWDAQLGALYESAELLVAHNIGFDSRVLKATAEHHAIKLKDIPTACTVKIARGELEISPAKLDNVCRVLDIPLKHHEALSDSLASAYIYLYAKTGKKLWKNPSSITTGKVMTYEKMEVDVQEDVVIPRTTKSKVKPKKLSKTISKLNSEKSKAALKAILKKSTKTKKDLNESNK